MRIQLLIGSMNVVTGGPPRVVAGTATALARLGHQIDIVSLQDGQCGVTDIIQAFPELGQESVSIHLFEPDAPARLGRSQAMKRLLERTIPQSDVVHAHGIWEGCLVTSSELARKFDVPFFISAHGMLDKWSLAQSAWRKRLARVLLRTGRMLSTADAIVYGTEDERVESQPSVPGSKSAVVPNGISLETLSADQLPASDDFAAQYPQIRDWTRSVLFFSRVHPKKGLALLLEAFIERAADAHGLGLMIVGIPQDLAYENSLRAKISQSAAKDRVVFTTDLQGPEARAVFRHADIFALPSHQEGFSMAILEAMALEKPLLISNRCHLPEVADVWNCGVVVDDDVLGVSTGLETLMKLSEPDLIQMGQRGRKAVIENYSWEAVAQRLEAMYREARA